MKNLLGLFLLTLLFTLNMTRAHAEIYMSVDKSGNITYSDTPMKNAEIITIPKSSAAPTPSEMTIETANEESLSPPAEIKPTYEALEIISPRNQESIQNQPSLIVELAIKPELQAGDTIQVFIDGKPIGQPSTSTHIDIGRIDRGTHNLYAIIFDKQKKILLQSSPITIYFHQAHVGFPPGKTGLNNFLNPRG